MDGIINAIIARGGIIKTIAKRVRVLFHLFIANIFWCVGGIIFSLNF